MEALSIKFKIIRNILCCLNVLGLLFCLYMIYLFFVREFNFYEIIQSHGLTLQLLRDTFVTVVYLTTNILFCKRLYKIKKDCEVYPSRIAGGFLCLLVLFIFDWRLIAPPMGAAKHPAGIVSCNSHMKQIHQACLEYADRYENCFPPDLKTLIKFMPELEEDQIHYCPEVFKHEGYSDYIYHGAGLKKNNLPDNFLLIEDKKIIIQNGMDPTGCIWIPTNILDIASKESNRYFCIPGLSLGSHLLSTQYG